MEDLQQGYKTCHHMVVKQLQVLTAMKEGQRKYCRDSEKKANFFSLGVEGSRRSEKLIFK